MSLRPRARIHLSNIADNWRTLRAAQVGGVTGAVIKADAYGHGLPEVATVLHEAGCDHFFVAHGFEAEVARQTLGSHPNIYVLNGPSPDEEALYRENALIFEHMETADKALITFLNRTHMMIYDDEAVARISHFAVAFFGYHLQGREDLAYYFSEDFVARHDDLAWGVYEGEQ